MHIAPSLRSQVAIHWSPSRRTVLLACKVKELDVRVSVSGANIQVSIRQVGVREIT